ncbi:MAG: 2-oxo acid dehydrogenase subunit E2, partial [Clostridia bacterium]|nr:2-oxo acid dehydrogenase subunit E2 [Clostridia bacterium]
PVRYEPVAPATSSVPAMPNAKAAAAKLGVDLSSVIPSNGSFIKKADVEAAAKPAVIGEDTLPTSVMRDMLSGKLERSAVPAAFLTVEASAESAVRVASAISARGRVKVTPGDLVLLALAKLADRFPCVAVRNEHGSLKKTDCMAFAFTGINGTVSAAVRGVSQMTLSQIAAEREKNAEMLSRGDMTPEGGASLTVFDLSDSDTDGCLPVLSVPEVAALSIGGIKTRPYAEDGLIKSRESFILTLAFDARVIDVPVAAELLSQLSGLVEDPALML